MKSPRVVYLITRTHGLKQHLLKSEQIVHLLRSKDMAEVYDFLLKTDYSKELSRISPEQLDVSKLEEIFYQKLSQRLFLLLPITGGRIRSALEDYCHKIEVENLKRIARAIHAKEKITEEQMIPIPRKYQKVNFSALLQARSIQEMINLLKASIYQEFSWAFEAYEKYNNPMLIEANITKICYEELWRRIDRVQDKTKVRDFVETEIDLKNLLFFLSLKYMKADVMSLQEMMISVHHKLPKSFVQQVDTASFEAIPEVLTWPPYKELAKKAVDLASKGMMSETENVFSQFLYSYAENAVLRNPNNLVYVFAYMQLCFREAKNLITLTVGKQLKLDNDRIRGLLFL